MEPDSRLISAMHSFNTHLGQIGHQLYETCLRSQGGTTEAAYGIFEEQLSSSETRNLRQQQESDLSSSSYQGIAVASIGLLSLAYSVQRFIKTRDGLDKKAWGGIALAFLSSCTLFSFSPEDAEL